MILLTFKINAKIADANFYYSECGMNKLLQESSVAMHYMDIQIIERVVEKQELDSGSIQKDIC